MPDSKALADTPIVRFFREYERQNASGDMAATASNFADTFLAAGPQGAQCVRAADFALALPKRKELFEKLGLRSSELASIEESVLDAGHALVRTQWRMHLQRPNSVAEEILVGSVFMVDTRSEPFKIIVYLANQDIIAVMKERGILQG